MVFLGILRNNERKRDSSGALSLLSLSTMVLSSRCLFGFAWQLHLTVVFLAVTCAPVLPASRILTSKNTLSPFLVFVIFKIRYGKGSWLSQALGFSMGRSEPLGLRGLDFERGQWFLSHGYGVPNAVIIFYSLLFFWEYLYYPRGKAWAYFWFPTSTMDLHRWGEGDDVTFCDYENHLVVSALGPSTQISVLPSVFPSSSIVAAIFIDLNTVLASSLMTILSLQSYKRFTISSDHPPSSVQLFQPTHSNLNISSTCLFNFSNSLNPPSPHLFALLTPPPSNLNISSTHIFNLSHALIPAWYLVGHLCNLSTTHTSSWGHSWHLYNLSSTYFKISSDHYRLAFKLQSQSQGICPTRKHQSFYKTGQWSSTPEFLLQQHFYPKRKSSNLSES